MRQPYSPSLTHLSRRMEQAWIETSRAEQRRANTAECEHLYDTYLQAMDEYVQAFRRASAADRAAMEAEQLVLPVSDDAVQNAPPPAMRPIERNATTRLPEEGSDYERGQRAICASKKAYPTEQFAKSVGRKPAIVEREGHALRAYQCPWCGYWHLSSAPGRQTA